MQSTSNASRRRPLPPPTSPTATLIQGISAGWADVYSAFLACQFIVIDGLPDGDYTLQSTTNAQHLVAEDCFGDNTIWTGLRITGNNVAVVDPPYIPEDRIPFNRNNVAAIQVGGRWKVAEGNHWMLDTGTSQGEADRCVEIINHYKLASMCFVGRPRCPDSNPMMYWLTSTGRAPSGHLPGEDCISFDPDHLAVIEIGGRWKVVEGTHWLLDFGPGQGNAIAALYFIRKYGFDQMCFVGRPDPSMTYFKKSRGRRFVDVIDPRRLEAAIEEPRWWRDLAAEAAALAPAVDFSKDDLGRGPNPRLEGQLTVDLAGQDTTEVLEAYGIRGLAVGDETVIHFTEPVGVVDLGIAHFGTPPAVVAHAGKKQVAKATVDPRPRQIENVRLVAQTIERVTLTAPDGGAILNYVRVQPATAESQPAESS